MNSYTVCMVDVVVVAAIILLFPKNPSGRVSVFNSPALFHCRSVQFVIRICGVWVLWIFGISTFPSFHLQNYITTTFGPWFCESHTQYASTTISNSFKKLRFWYWMWMYSPYVYVYFSLDWGYGWSSIFIFVWVCLCVCMFVCCVFGNEKMRSGSYRELPVGYSRIQCKV